MKDGELYRLLIRDYPEETKRLMDQFYCELEYNFMGFDELYEAAAARVPKDKVIIDVGCYMAAQAYLFRDFKKYIGVDICPQTIETAEDWYKDIPEAKPFYLERFSFGNTEHITAEAMQWLTEEFPKLGIPTEDCVFLCSAVPDDEIREYIKENFPEWFVWYPGTLMESRLFGEYRTEKLPVDEEVERLGRENEERGWVRG